MIFSPLLSSGTVEKSNPFSGNARDFANASQQRPELRTSKENFLGEITAIKNYAFKSPLSCQQIFINLMAEVTPWEKIKAPILKGLQ